MFDDRLTYEEVDDIVTEKRWKVFFSDYPTRVIRAITYFAEHTNFDIRQHSHNVVIITGTDGIGWLVILAPSYVPRCDWPAMEHTIIDIENFIATNREENN